MANIIIGTTPTIKYTFSSVSVSDISTAILTIKKSGSIVIEKTLEDAEVGENTLSWTLSQSETITIGTGNSKIMLNWLLNDGTRGASEESSIYGKSNHISEVINDE